MVVGPAAVGKLHRRKVACVGRSTGRDGAAHAVITMRQRSWRSCLATSHAALLCRGVARSVKWKNKWSDGGCLSKLLALAVLCMGRLLVLRCVVCFLHCLAGGAFGEVAAELMCAVFLPLAALVWTCLQRQPVGILKHSTQPTMRRQRTSPLVRDHGLEAAGMMFADPDQATRGDIDMKILLVGGNAVVRTHNDGVGSARSSCAVRKKP